MSLESGTYVSDLVATNPTGTDPKSQGDDHLRLIKSVLKNTLPEANGPVLVGQRSLTLGNNADQSKNFRILVPQPEDGTLTIERADGTDVMKFLAGGGAALNGGTVAPAAGMVGELVSANGGPGDISIGGAPTNMASISLTPGIWDVQVTGGFTPSEEGSSLQQVCGSLVSATIGNVSNAMNTSTIAKGLAFTISGYMHRLIVTATTTVYCVVRSLGTSGTISASATIQARRVA